MAIFRWINSWPDWMRPVFWFLSEGSKLGWVRVVLGLLAAALIAARPGTRRAAIQALIAFPIANGMTDVLKDWLQVLRPCVELAGVLEHGVKFLDSYGTASAHAANMAAVAFVMTYHLKWWGYPWVVVALFTGLSRIYMGLHYPSQVLLGWACGVFSALVIVKTAEAWIHLRNRRAQAPVRES